MNLLLGYWGETTRTYHHTAPTNSLYALHEALLLIREEGLENAWARVQRHHTALKAGLEAMGLKFLVKEVNLVDATCPTCAYGIDLDKAKQSVDVVSKLLKANCQQVDKILGGEISDADYEDLWRFTLATYHSGISCFHKAFVAVQDKGLSVTWENLGKKLACPGGADYVNGFMDDLNSFDFYLYEPADAVSAAALPTIVPTRTPVPTPTVYISSARIIVQVNLDRNRNGTPDPGEEIDAMSVDVNTLDGGRNFLREHRMHSRY